MIVTEEERIAVEKKADKLREKRVWIEGIEEEGVCAKKGSQKSISTHY